MNTWPRIGQILTPPRECLLCGTSTRSRTNLCAGCRADLPRRPDARCRRCALPLPTAGLCPACQRHPPPFARAWAEFPFEGGVRTLIHGLKFRGALVNAQSLGLLLAGGRVATHAERPEAVLPVPLHPARLRSRGYNQALELVRPLARVLDVELDARALQRTRPTAPQTEQGSAAARRRNVRRAFRLREGFAARHVAVFDDVMTSGATVSEICRVLRRGGVQRVDVWVLARAHR